MQPEAPVQKPRRYRHLVRCLLVVVIAMLGWYSWKAYDFNQAVKEAKELGWGFTYSDPIALIRANWKAAFRKETWNASETAVTIRKHDQWEPRFDLIHRLDPKYLRIDPTFPLRDLSKFTALSNLVALDLFDCPNLTNIDAVKDMNGLTELVLADCPKLTNIDALKELKHLETFGLYRCAALTNVDALRELTALTVLSLRDCSGLKNLDGILGLTGLKHLDLSGCHRLTNEAVAAVKVAIPNTNILSPDSDVSTLSGEIFTPDKK